MEDELERAYADMVKAQRKGGIAFNQARLHYRKLKKKQKARKRNEKKIQA